MGLEYSLPDFVSVYIVQYVVPRIIDDLLKIGTVIFRLLKVDAVRVDPLEPVLSDRSSGW